MRDGADPKTGHSRKVAIESGNVVEWVEEENWKFRLGAFKGKLLDHFLENKDGVYIRYESTGADFLFIYFGCSNPSVASVRRDRERSIV